jgi:acetyl esterase/lipase
MPTPDAHFQRLAERGTVAYVDAGTDEVLWDSVTRVVENMKAAGLNVKFTAYEGGTHCEYVFARTPIKLWPGVGFTWTLFLAQFKSCLKECWPDVVFPGA